jgi:hypothetical protein
MDPVTTAIMGALVTGSGKVTEKLISEAYEGLKSVIRRKLGGNSKVAEAITNLELEPDFGPHKMTLEERIKETKADQDPDIVKAAQALLDQINTQLGSTQHIQNAMGSYIAQAELGSTATVTVNHPEQQQ